MIKLLRRISTIKKRKTLVISEPTIEYSTCDFLDIEYSSEKIEAPLVEFKPSFVEYETPSFIDYRADTCITTQNDYDSLYSKSNSTASISSLVDDNSCNNNSIHESIGVFQEEYNDTVITLNREKKDDTFDDEECLEAYIFYKSQEDPVGLFEDLLVQLKEVWLQRFDRMGK